MDKNRGKSPKQTKNKADGESLIQQLLSRSNALVDVGGYKVKKESAALVTAIFAKYGDIAKESTFSVMESRSIMLEMLSSIYKRLEATSFEDVLTSEVKSMMEQMKDLELVKVEVGWLHRRLDLILKAMETYDDVSTVGDLEAKKVDKLREKLVQEKDDLGKADQLKKFLGFGSLVDGLV